MRLERPLPAAATPTLHGHRGTRGTRGHRGARGTRGPASGGGGGGLGELQRDGALTGAEDGLEVREEVHDRRDPQEWQAYVLRL